MTQQEQDRQIRELARKVNLPVTRIVRGTGDYKGTFRVTVRPQFYSVSPSDARTIVAAYQSDIKQIISRVTGCKPIVSLKVIWKRGRRW